MQTLVTEGCKPCPRYGHTMHYYTNSNHLVVYGGMNDQKKERFFNDVYLFNLENLNWLRVAHSC